jgi:type IV pilus assembly protein PilC
MIKIGEETSELDKVLFKIADNYDEEVDSNIESLISVIEPIMIVGLGIFLGIILIAIYLPMFDLINVIQQ